MKECYIILTTRSTPNIKKTKRWRLPTTVNHYNTLGVISNYHKNQLLTNTTEVRTQQLYFLRKVHKHPHQLRPIVSACSGPTEKILGLLTNILGPNLDDIASLVKNSMAVVNLLEGLELLDKPDILLVSLDVKSLYPSIPQGPGIEMAIQRVCPTSPGNYLLRTCLGISSRSSLGTITSPLMTSSTPKRVVWPWAPSVPLIWPTSSWLHWKNEL